jgi:hypothetical protein
LKNCDSFSFAYYQRNPTNNFTFVTTTNAAQIKLVSVSWRCSRQILGSKLNTESVQTATVVVRNCPNSRKPAMKITIASKSKRRAGVLILTVLLFAFAALFLATYFLLTQSEYTSVARSQAWNNSMALAEAGVEDALALINKNAGAIGRTTNWSDTAVSADHWTLVTNNVYSMTRWMGTNQGSTNLGYYTVYVTNSISGSNTGPAILSIGYANWNSSRSTFRSGSPARKVFVQTMFDGLINANLAAITTVDFNGNNVTLDSFNSGDSHHSDWRTDLYYHGINYGTYPANPAAASGDPDPTEPYKRKDNAYIATDGQSINDGNANVYGYVKTGPGGTTTVGANGTVGDVFWVPTRGIQPGHSQDDMNTIFKDVTLLTNFNSATTISKRTGNGANGVYNYQGYVFNYVITNTGYYQITEKVGWPLYIKGTNVFLYLPAGLNFKGNGVSSTMYGETNSDVTIYAGAPIDTTGNAGINNQAQYAPAFAIYGLPGCTDIILAGSGNIVAYVYAPEAFLHMGGSGGTYAGVGAFFVHNIQLNGNMGFHYDEALKLIGPTRAFIPTTWQEVQ